MMRRLGSLLCLAVLTASLAACGDGDTTGDGGVGMQGSTSVVGRCGDGTVDGSEQCDDGNNASGDGCSSVCAREGQSGDNSNGNPAGGSDAASAAPDGAASTDPAAGSGADASSNGGGGDDASFGNSDAGSGSDDASGPTEPEPLCPAAPTDTCEVCNCSMCQTQLDACSNLAGTATEGPASGQPKADLCEAVVRCGRSKACRSIGCVCTPETMATCLTGETPPDGPCWMEVLGASETLDMLTFVTRATSPSMGYAVFAAAAVSDCATASCAAACTPPAAP